MVGLGGLEPPTSRLSSARSNQLSYKPIVEYMFYNQLKAAMQAVFEKYISSVKMGKRKNNHTCTFCHTRIHSYCGSIQCGIKMLSLRLSKDLEERLEKISKTTNRSKTYYATKAIEKYLEDQEDYLLAIAALENDNGKRFSLAEVKKLAGLD